jgi:hypothetical protein
MAPGRVGSSSGIAGNFRRPTKRRGKLGENFPLLILVVKVPKVAPDLTRRAPHLDNYASTLQRGMQFANAGQSHRANVPSSIRRRFGPMMVLRPFRL